MKTVVHKMTETKSKAAFCVGICFEREIIGEEEIADKTNCISYGVGYINFNPVVKNKIYAIVDDSCNNTHYAKTNEFTPFLRG